MHTETVIWPAYRRTSLRDATKQVVSGEVLVKKGRKVGEKLVKKVRKTVGDLRNDVAYKALLENMRPAAAPSADRRCGFRRLNASKYYEVRLEAAEMQYRRLTGGCDWCLRGHIERVRTSEPALAGVCVSKFDGLQPMLFDI